MTYQPTTWVDDDGTNTVGTPFSASRMNNIENELVALDNQPMAQDTLQPGVIGAADLQATATGLKTTGSLSRGILVNYNAGVTWIKDASGILRRSALAAHNGALASTGNSPTSGFPANNSYQGYGVEVDPNGNLSISTTGTQETTAAAAQADIGARATTAGYLRLLDVVLFTNASGVTSISQSRDRRPWARGAYTRLPYAGADMTVNSAVIPNTAQRVECSGAPLRLTLRCRLSQFSSTDAPGLIPHIDGSPLTDYGAGNNSLYQLGWASFTGSVTSADLAANAVWDFTPSAGSHLFEWYLNGHGVIKVLSTIPMQSIVEEILRQNANNGTS